MTQPPASLARMTGVFPFSYAATLHSSGGDAAKTGTKPKKERSIDWGKFNMLVEGYAYIFGTDTVVDVDKRMVMKIADMAHTHGSDLVRRWKMHELRRTIDLADLVFDPTGQCDDHCVNLFGGLEMTPIKGDVEPLLDLMRYLVSRVSTNEAERDDILHWLTCWIAYPLQHLGTKLRTAVIMHGDEGAGKNFLFDLVVDIYGQYGVLVGQDELEDKFNEWRSRKMMVIGDEVSSRAELVHNKNKLKSLITSTTVQINPKGLRRRAESNHINVVFLSNELQPLALDNSDRRYLVIYTPRAKEFDYYRKLKTWRANDGAAKFYDYLLNYDCTGFDPFAPAPFTQAKADLIDINRKSAERFWNDWSQGLLDLPYRSCSVDQAYRAFQKYCERNGDRHPVQNNVFSRQLCRFAENQGHTVVVRPMQVPLTGGGRKGYRMLLVCTPAIGEGVTQGEWAASAVKAFATSLTAYVGGYSGLHSSTDQVSAEGGGDR